MTDNSLGKERRGSTGEARKDMTTRKTQDRKAGGRHGGKPVTLKGIWRVFLQAIKNFGSYNIPKLSASHSYYTFFSLGPLLVVLVAVGSMIFGHEMAEAKVYDTLSDFLGKPTADELIQVVEKASLEGKNYWAAIIGGITLLFGATTVFGDIQHSINSIWQIKARHEKGWLRMIKNRLLSFSILAALAFLLLVSLTVSAALDAAGVRIKGYFPDGAIFLFYALNIIVTLVIVTALFGLIFHLLPDAKIPWRDTWGGALITGILFMLGKTAISIYISKANAGEVYGAAGALVILLIWVYYSAMILYFGAAVTRHWLMEFGSGIKPDEDSATTKVVEIEKGKDYKSK